ncbi:MAG: hypothetical protein MIO87_03760 [Methanomassiliicoccales archaeon]|nr:hypothetical protein [Methanomassiliicoccales archaeon]
MADTSVTHTIFFIASVIVAASLAGVFIGISQEMSHSINEHGDQIRDLAESDIVIINDPAMMPYSNGILTLYLKNLSPRILGQVLDIFIDGTWETNYTVLDQQLERNWPPSGVLTLNLNVALSEGDHQVKVVLLNGASTELEFRI